MKYDDIKDNKHITLGVDNKVAKKLIDTIPKRYKMAYTFWSLIILVSIVYFIYLSITWIWWAGLILLFLVPSMIYKANSTSLSEHIIEHATENEQYYEMLTNKKLLLFKVVLPSNETLIFNNINPDEEAGARNIINAYGGLLEDTSIKATLDGKFCEDLLPFSKEIITKAINKLLTIDTDDNNVKLLQGGLAMLDDYVSC